MARSEALVIETNNLRAGGAAQAEKIATTLEHLLARMADGTRPLTSVAEVVVTHDGLNAELQARLDRAASRKLKFVELPPGTGYYAAKNLGFEATSAEVVAFADADCWPEPRWLEALLAPFAGDDVQVTAGRTTYRDDLLGIAATTIDFMYFDSPLGERCTRNFYANNVAFRRGTFEAFRYARAERIYRGHCQILGLVLQDAGVPVKFVPEARTVHRFPDSARDFVKLRMLRGADATELAPHLAKSYLPKPLAFLGKAHPVSSIAVLASRLAFSVRALNHQDMPELHGLKRAAAVGGIAAISALDAVGAMRRRKIAVKDGDTVSLGYHRDVDELNRQPRA